MVSSGKYIGHKLVTVSLDLGLKVVCDLSIEEMTVSRRGIYQQWDASGETDTTLSFTMSVMG